MFEKNFHIYAAISLLIVVIVGLDFIKFNMGKDNQDISGEAGGKQHTSGNSGFDLIVDGPNVISQGSSAVYRIYATRNDFKNPLIAFWRQVS